MLLIQTGRRSGLRRETVLEIMEYRNQGPEAVVMSAFGPHADWLRNIEANPFPEVVIGRERFVAVYRVLGEQEAMVVVIGYERRNWLVTPIVRSVLSRLLGWRYRGSEADRRRLVAQLPLVAFRDAHRRRSKPLSAACRTRERGRFRSKKSMRLPRSGWAGEK